MTVAVKHSFRSSHDELGPVTIRSSRPDPYAGIKGHDYIAARELNRPVQRVQTFAQATAATALEAK